MNLYVIKKYKGVIEYALVSSGSIACHGIKRDVLLAAGKLVDELKWDEVRSYFQIIDEGGNLIFKYLGVKKPDDYEIIHKLSGNKRLKLLHTLTARNLGHMTANMVFWENDYFKKNIIGFIPLMPKNFKRTDRGNYMVWGFGKIKFSDENKAGYYEIVKEGENYEIIKLVKEVKEFNRLE